MSITTVHRLRRVATTPLDGLLWLLLVLLLVPAVVALYDLPWVQYLAPWVIPALIASGVALGALLVLITLPARWWWVAFAFTALMVAAIMGGALLAARGQRSASAPFGTVVLGAYVAALSTCVPWLVFRAKQAWLAVLLIWGAVAGVWNAHLSPQQVWWVLFLLTDSLIVLGLLHLREEVQTWQRLHLERLGPVLWPAGRTIITLSIVVTVVGLIPLNAARIATLSQTLHRAPLSNGGPLAYQSASGTPVAVLGAPLGLDAPDVVNNQIILSYFLTDSPAVTPPVLGATLDTFDGSTWRQGSDAITQVASPGLQPPPGAKTVQGSIKVYAFPEANGASVLLSFDQPLSFSVPARASVLGGGTASADSIVRWESTHPLASGTSYQFTSAVLPDSATGSGTLPAVEQTRMTQVPATLDSQLRQTALAWAGNAQTPNAQAHALLDAMKAHLTLDPQATPPPGADGVTWLLTNKRGNVLLWTTTYILLGRSLGLPMRLAEGYLAGAYDQQLKDLVVRASDATVWAQLAIPGMGWLDLFPASNDVTVKVPKQIVYRSVPPPTVTPQPSPQPTPAPRHAVTGTTVTPGADNTIFVILAAAIIALLLVALALTLVSLRWRRFGAHLGPLTQFFARVALLARLAGIRLRPSDTPTQATAKVAVYVPEHAAALTNLNDAYERLRYGPPSTGEAGLLLTAQQQWHRLSGTLYRLVLRRPWRFPTRVGNPDPPTTVARRR